MAYLNLAGENSCLKLFGFSSSTKETTCLIGANFEPVSLISSNDNLDSCSFYSEPSDATILAFGEASESCGAIANAGSESCGAIAVGSFSSTSFAGSSSSGSACTYC